MNRLRPWLASIVGLAIGLPGVALAVAPQPTPAGHARAVTSNQDLASTIATQLRTSGRLRGYLVDVTVRAGVVDLDGSVASEAQREEVLRLVTGIPGVDSVRDRLAVRGQGGELLPTQGPQINPPAPPPARLPSPLAGPQGGPAGPGQGGGPDPKNLFRGPMPPGAQGGPGGDAGPGNGGMPEPKPLFRAPVPGYAAMNPPNMPPYAWPTYSPYNNFSRVAYPTAYPYNAFPFIGPIYPFPKVPLGWRSVKLEWDDGYWWFGRVGHKYDWWKLRFW